MKTSEIVQNLFRSLEQRDFTAAEGYLSYDFILTGSSPVPLSKRDFMSVMQNLLAGFPDLTFGLHDVQTVDDQASFFLHINGTNTQDIPSLFSGMPPIKATGKPVHLPEEPCTATFRGDKIREITVETVPGAGIQGLLEQLGVQIPLGLETPISSPVASTAG